MHPGYETYCATPKPHVWTIEHPKALYSDPKAHSQSPVHQSYTAFPKSEGQDPPLAKDKSKQCIYISSDEQIREAHFLHVL